MNEKYSGAKGEQSHRGKRPDGSHNCQAAIPKAGLSDFKFINGNQGWGKYCRLFGKQSQAQETNRCNYMPPLPVALALSALEVRDHRKQEEDKRERIAQTRDPGCCFHFGGMQAENSSCDGSQSLITSCFASKAIDQISGQNVHGGCNQVEPT